MMGKLFPIWISQDRLGYAAVKKKKRKKEKKNPKILGVFNNYILLFLTLYEQEFHSTFPP